MGGNNASETTDKGLISKIYKQFMQLHTREASKPIKKWVEDLNSYFSEGDIQMADKHMKRCSMALINREMQIKTTGQNGLHQKNLQTINTGEDVEKREPSWAVGGNVNWSSHYGE